MRGKTDLDRVLKRRRGIAVTSFVNPLRRPRENGEQPIRKVSRLCRGPFSRVPGGRRREDGGKRPPRRFYRDREPGTRTSAMNDGHGSFR